jgi:uncharacterized protein GlcG (DUF336 family)
MPELTLDLANRLLEAVFDAAADSDMPPLAAAVLDPGGHLKALQRQDGVSFLRAEICQAKAWGALALGVDSRVLGDRYADGVQQRGFLHGMQALTGGRIVPLPGGVLLRAGDGTLVGALGVAGGPSAADEACAIEAARRLDLWRGAVA